MLGIGNSLIHSSIPSALPAPLYSITMDGAGSHDLMTFSSTVFDVDGSDYSFSFWAKLDNADHTMTVFGGVAWHTRHIQINPTNGSFDIESDTNGDRAATHVDAILQTDATDWHHYVATVSSGTVALYYDGAPKSVSGDVNGDNMTITQLGVGGSGTSSSVVGTKFEGHLYQVAVWDKVLAAGEVTKIYNSGTPISLQENSGDYASTEDLIHLWNFDEGTGTSCADSAGSLTGTLTDDATFSADIPA